MPRKKDQAKSEFKANEARFRIDIENAIYIAKKNNTERNKIFEIMKRYATIGDNLYNTIAYLYQDARLIIDIENSIGAAQQRKLGNRKIINIMKYYISILDDFNPQCMRRYQDEKP
jgi:hypothetical protein